MRTNRLGVLLSAAVCPMFYMCTGIAATDQTVSFPSSAERFDRDTGWTKDEAGDSSGNNYWTMHGQQKPESDEYFCGWKTIGKKRFKNAGYVVKNVGLTTPTDVYVTVPNNHFHNGSLEVHFEFRFVKRSFFQPGADIANICKSGGYQTSNGTESTTD